MTANYKLVRPNDEFEYNPEPKIFYLYQVCQFKDCKNIKHHVRKLTYNEFMELVDTDQRFIKSKKLQRFIDSTPEHKYLMYPAFNLDVIDLPNSGQVLAAQSCMLE
jgi:hypothetical protein